MKDLLTLDIVVLLIVVLVLIIGTLFDDTNERCERLHEHFNNTVTFCS